MKNIIITIDGPAGSGKGEIAKYLSNKWSLRHLDSGIIYRRLAHKLLKNGVSFDDKPNILRILKKEKNLSFRKNKILRKEKISFWASRIAIHKYVRDYVNKFQREFVYKNLRKTGFVIDGRDIGSVVFKEADLKLYIEVNEVNRAKRRYKQLIDAGEKSIYPKILEEIKLRDIKDKCRKNSPLIVPNGAVKIDNNGELKKALSKINRLVTKLS